MRIRNMDIETFLGKVKKFHGHLAPGMVCGGFMVELAFQNLPEGAFYDVISETSACLPDSVQLLTPCTIGNGWLKIMNTGRFALIFYNKYTGVGVRVALDPERLKNWPELNTWAMKLKPKKDQDKKRIFDEIIEAGFSIYKVEKIIVSMDKFPKKGKISICTTCGESFRGENDADLCKACQNEMPFVLYKNQTPSPIIPVEKISGEKAAHDMTRITPGEKKGPEFKKGHKFTDSDIKTLKSMGKENIYASINTSENLIHEDDAALAFAEKMAGPGIIYSPEPNEGKIDFIAEHDGLLKIDKKTLKNFNMCSNVMCATKKSLSPVKKGMVIGGTRAIPLYIEKVDFNSALSAIEKKRIFSVLPYKLKRAGIIVTGTEVASGRVEDKFTEVIETSLNQFNTQIEEKSVCKDDKNLIKNKVLNFVEKEIDLIVLTGGLSVDPDDVTRAALTDAGIIDEIYGAPFLPGAMTLIGRIKNTKIIGVPAGALYFDNTGFDIILPIILADETITRMDIADMAEGGFLGSGKRIY